MGDDLFKSRPPVVVGNCLVATGTPKWWDSIPHGIN